MVMFLLRRVFQAIWVLWGVATIVFLLMRVLGNPAALMLPEGASPEEVAATSEKLGFNDPLIEQYGRYLGGLLKGDLGTSVWTGQPVLDTIFKYFPPTLYLALISLLLSLVVGIVLGTIAGARPGSIADRVVTVIAYLGISAPEFWVGILLIELFAVQVRLFPTSGYGGVAFFVLPVAAVMTRPVGRLAQTTRESLREELTKEYIVTGLAKGLPAITVLVRHALRNALTSVITLGGDELAALVAGAAAVEVIFAWPGTGFLSVQAIERRDTNLVLGIVLVVAAFVIVLNILIDIAYKVIDRRIELR